MNQYRLTSQKSGNSRRWAIVATTVVVIFILGIIAVSKSTKSVPGSPLAILQPQPTSAMDYVRKKADKCTGDSRDSFIKQANRIHQVFEDNFVLALSTSRIALSPVVGEMQRALRDLRQLATDACGEVTRSHLADAYEEAIGVFLSFMKQERESADLFALQEQLRDAYRFLLVYKDNLFAPFLLEDLLVPYQVEEKTPVPPELIYLSLLKPGQSRCDDAELVRKVFSSFWEASSHFDGSTIISNIGLTPTPPMCDGIRWLDTPVPTNTLPPPATLAPTNTPTITPTPIARSVLFKMDADAEQTYKVEYAENSASKRTLEGIDNAWSHSFVANQGDTVILIIADSSGTSSPSCIVLIDGKELIRKTKGSGDKTATCKMIVP